MVHENTKQNFQIKKKGQIRNDAGSAHDETQTCVHTCMGTSQWDPFLVQLRYTAFEGENIFGRIIILFYIFKKRWKHVLDFFETLSIVDGDILTDLWYAQFLSSGSNGNEILLASTFQLLKGWVRKQPRK